MKQNIILRKTKLPTFLSGVRFDGPVPEQDLSSVGNTNIRPISSNKIIK